MQFSIMLKQLAFGFHENAISTQCVLCSPARAEEKVKRIQRESKSATDLVRNTAVKKSAVQKTPQHKLISNP